MAAGTKVYTRASGVGSYVELPYVLGLTGSTITRSFSDNTAASEMTLSKYIGRVDPGTVSITLHLEDTATASNTYSGWRAGLTNARVRKPLIAAVEGYALAGGLELMIACDLVVANANAKFGIPEVKRGLAAAAGGLVRLPRQIPQRLAMELFADEFRAQVTPADQSAVATWLEGVKTLGLTAGASAPEILVREVVDALAAYRPISEKTITAAEEKMVFKLPRQLTE